LDEWLFADGKGGEDILVLAFQEIVELSAQQVVATDEGKRKKWEAFVIQTLDRKAALDGQRESDYVMLRSEQLVGTALMM
jgi:synaptojanin